MKKLQYILLVLVLVLASCNNKDSIWNVMGDMDSRVSTLETLCQEMNTNIAALETLIKAQNNGDYITNVTEIRNGNTIVGYTITFNHHDPITIYNGTNGKDGRDGVDGYKPTVGAKQDTDGVYYWTVDGKWLTDANGNKIRVTGEKGDKGDKGDTGDKGQDGKDGNDGTNGVNGNTPQLKIENNYWYISYDGTNWTQLGKATGADGKDGKDGTNGTNGTNGSDGAKGDKGDKGDADDTIFRSVTQDDNYVYFTLSDGTLIKLPKNGNSGSGTGDQPNSEFMFVVTFDANGGVGTMPKDTFYYGVAKSLTLCRFTKEEYLFHEWNTKEDGTGISYKDGVNLVIEKNITLYAQWASKELSGVFTTGRGKIKFSRGNLQYQASTNTWRFAEHQYDCIGTANKNISPMYNGWVDLFGWGTGNNPTDTSTDIENYQTFVDWGTNSISGYAPNTWRTLVASEWTYLFEGRENAENLRATATINGQYGIIILPDDWVIPHGVSFVSEMGLNKNIYSIPEWEKIEKSGAIFLPNSGYRNGKEVYNIGNSATYWAANVQSNEQSYCLVYTSGHILPQHYYDRNFGFSVRLVQNL